MFFCSGIILGFVLCLCAENEKSSGFFISTAIKLNETECKDGILGLKQDKRLEKRKQYTDRFMTDTQGYLEGIPEEQWPEHEFENAVLTLTSNDKKTLDKVVLKTPWIKIEKKELGWANRSIYFIRYDHQKGRGIFSGWGTDLYYIDGCSIKKVEALNIKNSKMEAIELDDTLRCEWLLKGSKIHPGEFEIHQVICVPYAENGSEVTYERYYLENGSWKKYSHTKKGYWETSYKFPDDSCFLGK